MERRALRGDRPRAAAHLRAAPRARGFEDDFYLCGERPAGRIFASGTYAILRGRGADATPVGRVGGYRLSTPAISLMVRYESAAGWVTYSPELSLDSRVAESLSWERRLASR